MDLIPGPPDLFHPALPDTDVNSPLHRAWQCTRHNKNIRGERGAMSKRDVGPAASSHKLFSVLLMVGWIVGCTAVVYFVFLFAWVECERDAKRKESLRESVTVTERQKACINNDKETQKKWSTR
ncbi:hypothetical protein Q8A73_006530 [Channa argus]|nr:hypothetical protein Q8A73_006530 [Channa argus]